MPKISIVIPVYNVEHYIERCVTSCIGQDMHDIEVVCVNDGSTDASLSVLQRLAASDSRIRIVDTPNHGVVHAREEGIAIASGDYITFVDGDDYLAACALERLYAKAVESNADIVNGDIVKITGDERRLISRGDAIHTREEFISSAFSNDDFYNVARLFRRELFDKRTWFCPENITHNEDVILVLSLAISAKRIVSCGTEVYFYIYRQSSVSGSFSQKQYDDVLKVRKMVWQVFRQNGWFEQYRSELLFFMLNVLFNILRFGDYRTLSTDDFDVLSLRNLRYGRVSQLLKAYQPHSVNRLNRIACCCPQLYGRIILALKKLKR